MRSLLLILVVAMAGDAFSQGTFHNLNFEETTLPYSSNAVSVVATVDAFPGWTISYDSVPQTQVSYNGVGLPPAVYLWSRDFGSIPPVPASFGLFSAVPKVSGGLVNVSLSQVGTIPDGVNSLSFETYGQFNANSLQVNFGGNLLPLEMLPGPSLIYRTWRVDLGALAGQNGELRITAIPQPTVPSTFRLDNLQFSSVPEPSTWALLVVGGVVLWCVRRRAVQPRARTRNTKPERPAPLAQSKVMPWGQTVPYVRSVEGTIVGLATPMPA